MYVAKSAKSNFGNSFFQILEMRRVAVEGHDILSMLYNFLDECLFMFNCEPFFLAKVKIFTILSS
jgi:SHS2 domain-containing protein